MTTKQIFTELKKLGIKQSVLGARLDVSPTTVVNWVYGRTEMPRPAKFMALMLFLKHSAEEAEKQSQ